jgi:antitoxin component YwqK of YwqJK toxin-antitoxin module
MKRALMIILLMVVCATMMEPSVMYAQKDSTLIVREDGKHTVYRNKDGKIVLSKDSAFSYREIVYKNGKPVGIATDYYMSGKVKMVGRIVEEHNKVYDYYEGKFIDYYENGNIQQISIFKNNKFDGLCSQYYETGEKRVETPYKNDLVHGKAVIFRKDGTISNEYHFSQGVLTKIKNYFSKDNITVVSVKLTGTNKINDNSDLDGEYHKFDAKGTLIEKLTRTNGEDRVTWSKNAFVSEEDAFEWISKGTWTMDTNDPNNTMNLRFGQGVFREWGHDPNQYQGFDDNQMYRICEVDGKTIKIARMSNQYEYNSVCNYHARVMFFTRTGDNTMDLRLESGGGTMRFRRH